MRGTAEAAARSEEINETWRSADEN